MTNMTSQSFRSKGKRYGVSPAKAGAAQEKSRSVPGRCCLFLAELYTKPSRRTLYRSTSRSASVPDQLPLSGSVKGWSDVRFAIRYPKPHPGMEKGMMTSDPEPPRRDPMASADEPPRRDPMAPAKEPPRRDPMAPADDPPRRDPMTPADDPPRRDPMAHADRPNP